MKLIPMDAYISPINLLEYYLYEFLHSPLFPIFLILLVLIVVVVIEMVRRVRAAQLKNSLEMKSKTDEPQSAPDDEPSCNS